MSLDLSVLSRQGIAFKIVGAHPSNYGYPRGATHQCDPQASMWHITGSKVSPGPNPLAGLDSWFNNPDAVACAHLGISGLHVHEYVPWHVAPYQAGYVARPDVGNPIIADWVARRQNPNFWSYGIEVVAEPSGARVQPGVHLVSPDTWRSMLLVDEQLHLQLGIPRTLDAHLGHGQIDGVNRTRDPFNVYLPSDIFAAHTATKTEEDDVLMPVPWVRDDKTAQSYVIVAGKKRPVDGPAQEAAYLKSKYIRRPEVMMTTAELATIPSA